jgi:hypothetical protein
VLDEIVPGVSTHSLVFLARGITLVDGAARLGSIEPERLAELDARLRAWSVPPAADPRAP